VSATFVIKDSQSSVKAKITERGQIVVAPLEFSVFYTASTASNNVAVNIVAPTTSKRFVITDIVIAADRSVGANGAITDIFEASGPTSATIVKSIYEDEIAKQTRATLTGLNIIVSEGVWINVKSDDVIVRANIAGYFIDA